MVTDPKDKTEDQAYEPFKPGTPEWKEEQRQRLQDEQQSKAAMQAGLSPRKVIRNAPASSEISCWDW